MDVIEFMNEKVGMINDSKGKMRQTECLFLPMLLESSVVDKAAKNDAKNDVKAMP